MSDDLYIEANLVTKDFGQGHVALSDVSFQVQRGEFVSIVGPSGCGKSTLLQLIAGLSPVTHGELKVDGRVPNSVVRSEQRTAFVFQDANLLPWRTVIGNIRLPLELQSRTSKIDRRRRRAAWNLATDEGLKLIGLSKSDGKKRPSMLSGGMRMRVSLARALVTKPELLLLDEPFGALDDILRQQLNEELLRMWGEKKCTAIFVTHNVAEAVFLSERILVMSNAPGSIARVVDVPFSYPRTSKLRADPEFARLSGEVSQSLRQGVG